MNGKERAKLAFAFREADRIPIFELDIDNPTAEFVLGRPALCGFGGKVRGKLQNKALMEGHFKEYTYQRVTDEIELWRALDLDVCVRAFPVAVSPLVPEQIDETTWRFEDAVTGQWSITRFIPESDMYDQIDSSLQRGGLAELERLTQALEAKRPCLEDWDFEPVDRFISELGNDKMVFAHLDVQLGHTWDWGEFFLIGLVQAPSLIHRYLDALLKVDLMIGEALLERGIDGLLGGCDWASSRGPMFSPRHFREFVFPRIKQITELCHRFGVPFVKHTDGNVNILLDDMILSGIDAYHAIEPRAGMDIAAIKQQYGDRLTLIGNVDCSTVLVDGPVEAVRAETERVVRAAAPGGGFLLSTSNSVHPGVKPEYYLAMLEAARAMGNYPIQPAR